MKETTSQGVASQTEYEATCHELAKAKVTIAELQLENAALKEKCTKIQGTCKHHTNQWRMSYHTAIIHFSFFGSQKHPP